jgi:hypothetical protein
LQVDCRVGDINVLCFFRLFSRGYSQNRQNSASEVLYTYYISWSDPKFSTQSWNYFCVPRNFFFSRSEIVNKCKTNYFFVAYGYEMPRIEISLIPCVSDLFNTYILVDRTISMGGSPIEMPTTSLSPKKLHN